MHELAGGGDDGSTGLLGGGRVAKDDLRIEVYGTVDEASSAIGLAKALTSDERVREMAELATNPADTGKFGATSETDVAGLDALLATLEAEVEIPRGFILPGSTPAS